MHSGLFIIGEAGWGVSGRVKFVKTGHLKMQTLCEDAEVVLRVLKTFGFVGYYGQAPTEES